MSSLALGLASFFFGLVIADMSAGAADFNAKKLMSDGEVYVIALRETYFDAARLASERGEATAARFFRDRVTEIENGGELFPAHPSIYPCADEAAARRLDDAYKETFAVATSEAADVEPYLVAAVQVTYEEWLISLHANARDPNAGAFEARFERRLDALTQPQILSRAAPFRSGEVPLKSFRLVSISHGAA